MTVSLHENILFDGHGGLGKAIASTGFLKALRKAHPEIKRLHVRSTWGDVFRELPFVTRHYDLNQAVPYFAEDHRDFEVIAGEPYLRLGYRLGKDHLVDSWFRMAGLEPPEEKAGTIKVLEVEHRNAMAFLAQTPRNKKWVAFQPFGGNGTNGAQVRSFQPDVAQAIADKLKEKGFIVIHIGLPQEPAIRDTIRTDPGKNERGEQMFFAPRTLFAILNLCEGFIGIDSFAQHAWAALGKKAGIVCWGGTRPENLGYPTNRNLVVQACGTPGCNRPDFLGDWVGGANQIWSCPEGENCMRAHNAERVVQELIEANGWKDYRPAEEKPPETAPGK